MAQYTEDEDIIVAGLLHDVIEDVAGYFREDMRREFGERVLNIVEDVETEKRFEVPDAVDEETARRDVGVVVPIPTLPALFA